MVIVRCVNGTRTYEDEGNLNVWQSIKTLSPQPNSDRVPATALAKDLWIAIPGFVTDAIIMVHITNINPSSTIRWAEFKLNVQGRV